MQRPNHCRCQHGPYLNIRHRRHSILPERFADHRPQTLTLLCLDCNTLFRSQAHEHQQHPLAPTNWRSLSTTQLIDHWNKRTLEASPPTRPPPTQPEQPQPAAQALQQADAAV